MAKEAILMNWIEIEKHQQKLFEIITRYKSNSIKNIREMYDLKRYIFKGLYLDRDNKEDVYCEFLCLILSCADPKPHQVYSYIKSKVYNAMVNLGIIKLEKYKSGQQVDGEKIHEESEVISVKDQRIAWIECYGLCEVLDWKNRTELF
jgi:hypothetical protein